MYNQNSTNSLVLPGFHPEAASLINLFECLPSLAYYRCKILKDRSYILEFVTKGIFDLVGFNDEELLKFKHNTFERMMNPEDCERQSRQVDECIKRRQAYDVTYRLNTVDGQTMWVWDRGRAIYDKNTPVYLEGILTNVSGQKQVEMDLLEENERLRASMVGECGFCGIIGTSAPIQNVFAQISKAAKTDANVVIYGETGTGKELTASAIHELSACKGRFVAVNCGAIPSHLMESEFFGYKKGAFTGAFASKQGFLAAADNGTLFLDEVGELDLGMQVKLLRALEGRQFVPVGDNAPVRSDFRLVAATNRNLKEMVANKTMREDFFFRIHVLDIHVPPLRERKDDLHLLIENYLNKKSLSETVYIPPSVRRKLEAYSWPGNIRELQNVLDKYICFGQLSFMHKDSTSVHCSEDAVLGKNLQEAVQELEKNMILQTLELCRWHRGNTANELGLNLRTLQRKMKAYGL